MGGVLGVAIGLVQAYGINGPSSTAGGGYSNATALVFPGAW